MSDCCAHQLESKKLHLVIIGGGSAAFSAALKAGGLGAQVTIINDGLPIGGTCVNVGCVPSKTLIRAAEVQHRALRHQFKGITSSSQVTDFKALIQQKKELVEGLRQAKYLDVIADLPDVQVVQGRAELTAPDTVSVNGKTIKADRILIATGASAYIPPVPGLKESGYLTNISAFELNELPKSMIVLGGRYIALECAQMFARLGTKVSILQRSSRILPTESEDLTDELTQYLTDEGINVVTGVALEQISKEDGKVSVKTKVNGQEQMFQAEHILVTMGRTPNTKNMGLESIGIQLDDKGFIKVNDQLQTSVKNVYAAGDVIGEPMYVYTAAYEGALAAENAMNNASPKKDYTALPWVIFTDPQVTGVGLDERQAQKQGIDADTSKLPLSHVPRSIAARDTRGFIKLIRDKKTDKLVGARILAPEGSELLMEVSLAIRHGIKVKDIVSAFHPYLTLSEGIKLAAITFSKDVGKLSCCAS